MSEAEKKVQQTAEDENMIVCDNLVKIYKTQEIEVVALQGLDLTVKKGEMMAIIGNSGSGKSTLLNMLGGLDKPSAGALTVDGKNLLKYTDRDMIKYKRETVGFVWQNNARNLIPYLTAVENIELPMVISSKRKKRQRAMELLEQVGLAHRKNISFRAVSSRELPSPLPLQTLPSCCWQTNPPAQLTPKPQPTSLSFSASSTVRPA